MKTLLPALGLLLAVMPALAQDDSVPPKTSRKPVEMLPATSTMFVQFDGMAEHKAAYDKTVLGQLMKHDLGDFFKQLLKSCDAMMDAQIDEIKAQARAEAEDADKMDPQHRAAVERSRKKEIRGWQDRKKLMHLLDYFWVEGLVVGAEAKSPTDFQVTCVLPQGAVGKNWDNVQRLLKLCAEHSKYATSNLRGRTIHTLDAGSSPLAAEQPALAPASPEAVDAPPPPLLAAEQPSAPEPNFAWWKEGDHVVCVFGTRPVKDTLDVIDGETPNLTSNPHYKKVAAFDQYDNCCRGFVAIKQLVDLVANFSESENGLARGAELLMRKFVLGQTGLTGIDSLTFNYGFERKYCRSTVKLNIVQPEQRQGLLKLISGPVSFDAKDLPPLPEDADFVSVHHVDWQQAFDTVEHFYQMSQVGDWLAGGGPLSRKKMPSLNAQIQDAIGVDLRNELLAALDTTVVVTEAYSEGPWVLGTGLAIKVKDAEKLQAALEKVVKQENTGKMPCEMKLKQSTYHGATIYTLDFGALKAPSYTIHDGWFVLGLCPQNVRSHVWRMKHPQHCWKTPAVVDQAIQAGLETGNPNTKLAAVTVIDPRRAMETVLPFAPVLALQASTVPKQLPDFSGFPHTKAITTKLSPNVVAFFDDGDAWRWESYATLDIPSGTEIALMYFGLGALFSGELNIPFVTRTSTRLPSAIYVESAPQLIPATPCVPAGSEATLPPSEEPFRYSPQAPGACPMMPGMHCQPDTCPGPMLPIAPGCYPPALSPQPAVPLGTIGGPSCPLSPAPMAYPGASMATPPGWSPYGCAVSDGLVPLVAGCSGQWFTLDYAHRPAIVGSVPITAPAVPGAACPNVSDPSERGRISTQEVPAGVPEGR